MTVITPREGEKVLFVIRKSFFKKTKNMIKFLLFLSLGVLMILLVQNDIVSLVAIGIIIFSLVYAFYHFLIWFYDLYIITNERIVSVEQTGIFSKEYSEMELVRVKDVTYSINGILATLFKFGNVKIKGDDGDIELRDLVDPDDAQEMIKKLASDAKKEKGQSDLTAEDLIKMLMKKQK